jgi:hypothetical protein
LVSLLPFRFVLLFPIMDPSASEMQGMADLAAVSAWVGLQANVREAMDMAFGPLTLLREVVLIPRVAFDQAVMTLRVWDQVPGETAQPPVERPPRAVELGQVESLRRVCRLRLGLPATEVEPGQAVARAQEVAPGPAAATLALGVRKIKLASVIDQGDDGEILSWDVARVRSTMAAFKTQNDGEEPDDDEDISGDQLAALHHKLVSGAAPVVDFAVWRPHGSRLARQLKLTVMHLTHAGEYVPHEVPGPPSLQAWQAAWRVFAVGMRALGAGTVTRLNLYSSKIAKVSELYGEHCWWLIAQADARMRSERMEKLRRRAEEARAKAVASGSTHEFDPLMPWDYLFKEAARDKEFWDDELDRKCLLYITHLRTVSQLADDGTGTRFQGDGNAGPKKTHEFVKKTRVKTKWKPSAPGGGGRPPGPPGPPRPPPKGKGKGKDGKGKGKGRLPDGRHRSDGAGHSLCWRWNHTAGGCSAVCPQDRAHMCEWCLDAAHRSIECAQQPAGWAPP